MGTATTPNRKAGNKTIADDDERNPQVNEVTEQEKLGELITYLLGTVDDLALQDAPNNVVEAVSKSLDWCIEEYKRRYGTDALSNPRAHDMG